MGSFGKKHIFLRTEVGRQEFGARMGWAKAADRKWKSPGGIGKRAAAGMHFSVCMLRENIRPQKQENETVSF